MALKPIGAILAGTLLNSTPPAPQIAGGEAVPSVVKADVSASATPNGQPPSSDDDAIAAFQQAAAKPRQCEGNCADCAARKLTP